MFVFSCCRMRNIYLCAVEDDLDLDIISVLLIWFVNKKKISVFVASPLASSSFNCLASCDGRTAKQIRRTLTVGCATDHHRKQIRVYASVDAKCHKIILRPKRNSSAPFQFDRISPKTHATRHVIALFRQMDAGNIRNCSWRVFGLGLNWTYLSLSLFWAKTRRRSSSISNAISDFQQWRAFTSLTLLEIIRARTKNHVAPQKIKN